MTKSWRDVLPIHPAAELFPVMTPDELRELGEDIKKNGLRNPCCLAEDQYGEVVLFDGRNRLDALELIGQEITLNNSVIFERFPADDIDVAERVISLNIHRRHLTAEQKRELVGKLIKAQPEKSDLQIAKTAKVGHPTVARVRKKLEAKGDVERRSTRTDTKGRKQPAKKAPTSRAKRANKPKNAPADNNSKARSNVGPASAGEAERLRVRVEALQADKRRLEMKVAGLESEVEEAKAAAKPSPGSKPAPRCSICHEKKQAVLRPVFICDECVDIHEVREAAPPDDGLAIPESLRREPAR